MDSIGFGGPYVSMYLIPLNCNPIWHPLIWGADMGSIVLGVPIRLAFGAKHICNPLVLWARIEVCI